MSYPQVTDETLPTPIVNEFENQDAQLQGWADVDHKADGTHKAIRADRLTTTGDVTVGGDLTADGDVTAQAGTTGEGRVGTAGQISNDTTAGRGLDQQFPGAHLSRFAIVGTDDAVHSCVEVQTYLTDGTGYTPLKIRYDQGTDRFSVLPGEGTAGSKGVDLGYDATGERWTTLFVQSGVFEAGRTTKLGGKQSVAFAAGHFTASGSMTWTVTSGEQVTFDYAQVGDLLYVWLILDGTTVGGTASTQLQVAIPGGLTAQQTVVCPCRLQEGATERDAIALTTAGSAVLAIKRKDGANLALGTTTVQCSLVFVAS